MQDSMPHSQIRNRTMSRLRTVPASEATGKLADLYAAIERTTGKVPNVYATLGSCSPGMLSQILQLRSIIEVESGLSRRELVAINLAVSEDSKCDYCVATHTLTGRATGFTVDQLHALRSGHYPEDPTLDALIRFALRMVDGAGTLPQAALDDVRSAGFSDRKIVGAISAVGATLITNMFNRVNDTVLDLPSPE